MLKRITAYTLIAMANLAFLAHAVVPHHHHHNVVCYAHAHCANHDHEAKGSTPNENEHQHEKSSSTCVLKQLVLLPSNQTKHDGFELNQTPQFPHFDAVPHSDAASSSPSLNPLLVIFDTENTSLFIQYVTLSKGLRAPPTV